MTKVSIITPVYNPSARSYEFSKESLDAQTSKDFEWIIVDDGSDENPFWREITLDRNYGPSVARNIGFQVSSGEIITYLDMGDELEPNRVENLIRLFHDFDIELLFSAYDIIQNDKTFRFNHFDYIGPHSRFHDFSDYLNLLQYQNISIPMGVAHTRKSFVECGGFQRGIVCGEDGILWRRMADKIPHGKIMFSDTFAGTYYVSDNGQSRTQRRFEMGGFAIEPDKNGKELDDWWFSNFNSNGFYD